jgi:transcriptional regulator with XRE-family HTH domain
MEVPMLAQIIRRYQSYNPETGAFDAERSANEYARLLGVNHSTLSLIYSGARNPGISVVRGLARAFPAAAGDLGAALVAGGVEDERRAVTA